MKGLIGYTLTAIVFALPMTAVAKTSDRAKCSSLRNLGNLKTCLRMEHNIRVRFAGTLDRFEFDDYESRTQREDAAEALRDQTVRHALKQLAKAYEDHPELEKKEYRVIHIGRLKRNQYGPAPVANSTRFHDETAGKQPTATIGWNLNSDFIADFLSKQRTKPKAVKEYEKWEAASATMAERIRNETGVEEVRCLRTVRLPRDCFEALGQIWLAVKDGGKLDARRLLVGERNQVLEEGVYYVHYKNPNLEKFLSKIPKKEISEYNAAREGVRFYGREWHSTR